MKGVAFSSIGIPKLLDNATIARANKHSGLTMAKPCKGCYAVFENRIWSCDNFVSKPLTRSSLAVFFAFFEAVLFQCRKGAVFPMSSSSF